MKFAFVLGAALAFCVGTAQGEDLELVASEGSTLTVGTPVTGLPKACVFKAPDGTETDVFCGYLSSFRQGKDNRTAVLVIPETLEAKGSPGREIGFFRGSKQVRLFLVDHDRINFVFPTKDPTDVNVGFYRTRYVLSPSTEVPVPAK